MIKRFSTLYIGHIELENCGHAGTPADDRRYPNERVIEAFDTTLELARTMDELGMRPVAAHCHLGLGKLYARSGKRAQAQEHLTTAATLDREIRPRQVILYTGVQLSWLKTPLGEP